MDFFFFFWGGSLPDLGLHCFGGNGHGIWWVESVHWKINMFSEFKELQFPERNLATASKPEWEFIFFGSITLAKIQ